MTLLSINALKNLKKEHLIALMLNLQHDREKPMEKFCQPLDTLSNTVNNLPSKLDQNESSPHRLQKNISPPPND